MNTNLEQFVHFHVVRGFELVHVRHLLHSYKNDCEKKERRRKSRRRIKLTLNFRVITYNVPIKIEQRRINQERKKNDDTIF